MARKKTADAAKDKAAKQKKIVIGLVVFLALAMAYAYTTMSGLSGGGPASSKPQPSDSSAVAPPSAVAPVVAAPTTSLAPSLAGGPLASTPTAASSTDSSQLVSVVIPKADSGQLSSFTRFASKDPFAGGAPTTSSSGGSKGSPGSGATPTTPPAPPAPPPTSAVIAVNGTSESVASGANFPAANPVATTNGLFQLVALAAHSATVTVVGGSYASGSSTLTLQENKPVTLVNTADGTRFTLVLYPQGSVAPKAPAGGSSAPSTPSVPTTPTTTTPTGP